MTCSLEETSLDLIYQEETLQATTKRIPCQCYLDQRGQMLKKEGKVRHFEILFCFIRLSCSLFLPVSNMGYHSFYVQLSNEKMLHSFLKDISC